MADRKSDVVKLVLILLANFTSPAISQLADSDLPGLENDAIVAEASEVNKIFHPFTLPREWTANDKKATGIVVASSAETAMMKIDGTMRAITIAKLSKGDQAYLKRFREAYREREQFIQQHKCTPSEVLFMKLGSELMRRQIVDEASKRLKKLNPTGKDFVITDSSILGDTRIIGMMKNNTDRDYDQMKFELSMFSEDGRLLDVETFFVSDMKAHTETPFKLYMNETIPPQATFKLRRRK